MPFEATGTEFALVSNPVYPNLTVTSSEEIRIVIEAITNTVSFHIEPITNSQALTTTITVAGINPASFPNFRHQDGFFISELPTDGNTLSWTQDLTTRHHVYLLPKSGTINIWGRDDARDEMVSKGAGIWLDANTCQLTGDITDNIVIQADNITLDGDGRSIVGPGYDGYGYGIYLNNRTGVTIRNCNIQNFSTGLEISYSNYNTFSDNTANSNGIRGIHLYSSSNITIARNTTSSNTLEGITISLAPTTTTLPTTEQSQAM
jgi:parallel beta-helix repeat protein